MSAFAKLKEKTQKSTEMLEKNIADANSNVDKRYWRLTVDKEQTGSAIIRFLPAPEGEEFPYVAKYTHQFRWPTPESKNWFFSNCHTTLEKECPICQLNNDAWNTETKTGQDLARYRKRVLSYVSNIYVISDPANPDNNGKVFLFSYGARIFQKIESALAPKFEDMVKFNPYDFWGGANLRLRSRLADGQRNYDLSEWDKPAPLLDDDNELERIWNSQYSLKKEVSPDKFQSFEEVKARFDKMSKPGYNPGAKNEQPTQTQYNQSQPTQAYDNGFSSQDELQTQTPPSQTQTQQTHSQPAQNTPTQTQSNNAQTVQTQPVQTQPVQSQPAETTAAPQQPSSSQSLADKYRQMLKK